MTRSRPILGLAAALVIGCSVIEPGVVRAAEAPFPNAFTDASAWTRFGMGSLPGAPARFTNLAGLLRQLDGFLAAGIRTAEPGSGVTITVPDGALDAREVHVFVTVVGGATDAAEGTQMRLVIRRDASGWWLDPQGQRMVFCGHALPPGRDICH